MQLTLLAQAGNHTEVAIIAARPAESNFIGAVCARSGSTITLRVKASDADDHMCQGAVTGQVANYILQNTNLSVQITSTGIAATVPLVSDQAGNVTVRNWHGSWSVPSNTVGQMLSFQFSGSIADKPCSTHGDSNDPDVSLDGYYGQFAVYKVDIEPDLTNLCWKVADPVQLILTNSWFGTGGIEWSGTNGLKVVSADNTKLVFTPTNSTPASYTVRATARDMTNCWDESTVNVIKVELDNDLWWFNGENPGGGYNITATLTVSPLTTGTFKWDVIAGTDRINLNNGGADADSITATDDNTVTVKSTSPSATAASVAKDVTVQLTYNGTPVCTLDLAVFAPHSLHHLANIDHDYAALPPPFPDYTGYWCEIKYEILDQFGRVLPYDVPWNEDFNKDGANPVSGISDYTGENWGWGPESGWSVPPSGAIDNLARHDLPGLVPPAQNVGAGTVKVDHVIGAWYVGSTKIGDGVLVLDNNKWQMYQDHGRHE